MTISIRRDSSTALNHSETHKKDAEQFSKVDASLFQAKVTASPLHPRQLDQRTWQQISTFSADLVGFVGRLFIEQKMFQNYNIPQDLLLYLANDLIQILVPKKRETLNVSKELSVLWKQLRGHRLTPEEEAYDKAPKKIDVLGEILNGVKYSSAMLMGKNLYSSVSSAFSQGLWKHIPAIVGYSTATLVGAKAIDAAVSKVFDILPLMSPDQKAYLRPWLNMVGRLALVRFMPKVHATEHGVHYHYPSTQTHTQTVSPEQTVTLNGDHLSIERKGQFSTPEGTYEATHAAEYRLQKIYELSNEKVGIQVVNREGIAVPVEFVKLVGEHGPIIQVKSDDKELQQHWATYFAPRIAPPMTSSSAPNVQKASRPIQAVSINNQLACTTGLAMGALGTLSTYNPVPMTLGMLSCLSRTTASTTNIHPRDKEFSEKIDKLLTDQNYWGALDACLEATSGDPTTIRAEAYYQAGRIHRILGRYTSAHGFFAKAFEKDPQHIKAGTENLEMDKFIKDRNNIEFREAFLKELEVTAPAHGDYILMGLLAYSDLAAQNTTIPNKINRAYLDDLKSRGWNYVLSKEFNCTEHAYYGVAFINDKTNHIVIASRGTDFFDKKSAQNDVAIIMQKKPEQYGVALRFTEEIAKKYPKYAISHTGHSLGAADAQLVAYSRNEIAVVADSPGIKSIVANLYNTDTFDNVKLVSYQSMPNIVNTYGDHIGDLRALTYTAPPTTTGAFEKILGIFNSNEYVKRVQDVAKAASIIEEEISSHGITNLLEAFDKSKRYATTYRHIKRWPSGPQRRVFFGKLCRDEKLDPFNPVSASRDVNWKIRQDYETVLVDHLKIDLSLFSADARKFLKEFYNGGSYYKNMNLKMLMMYEIENNVIILKNNEELFTIDDFKNEIEHELFEAKFFKYPTIPNPYRGCFEHMVKRTVQTISDEYEIFFNLKCIRKLSNLETLKNYFKEGNQKEFRKFLKDVNCGGPKIEEEITKELQSKLASLEKMGAEPDEIKKIKKLPNGSTLIIELFNKRVQEDNGVLVQLGKQRAARLPGKRLYIKAETGETFISEIAEAERECKAINFTMIDRSVVKFKFTYNGEIQNVIIKKCYTSSLFDTLSKWLVQGEHFIIEFEKDVQGFRSWIQPGQYQLVDISSSPGLKQFNIEEVNANARYQVTFFYKNGRVHSIEVIDGNHENQKWITTEYELSTSFLARRFSETHIDINPKNIDQMIKIEPVLRNERFEKFKQIEKLEDKLMRELEKDISLDYMAKILNHIVKYNFKEAPKYASFIDNKQTLNRINNQLDRINKLYSDIGEPKNTVEVLIDAIIEAIYQKSVAKSGSLLVSKAMELFAEGVQRINEIAGKDVVLFISLTGAGKGVSINYLLKTPLEKVDTFLGETYIIDPNHKGKDLIPSIGSSVSQSDTYLVRGYPAPKYSENDELFMLCDTPGLEDTRGEAYDLSASLSLDQVIQQARSIKAVVILVPFEAFTLNRGEPVVHLMESHIKQFIPNVFNATRIAGKEKSLDGVYILMTKVGDRTDQQIQEGIWDRVCAPAGKQAPIHGEIWNALCTMKDNGRVHTAQIENQVRAEELLEAYRKGSPGLLASDFAPSLHKKDMRIKLGNKIQSAAQSWIDEIIKPYLFGIQKSINQTLQENKKSTDSIANSQLEIANYKKSIERQTSWLAEQTKNLQEFQKQVEEFIKKEQCADGSTSAETYSKSSALTLTGKEHSWFSTLQEHATDILQSELTRLKGALEECENAMKRYSAEEKEIEENIKNIQSKIEKKSTKILELQTKIVELSDGNMPVVFDSYKPKPESSVSYCLIPYSVMAKAKAEMRLRTSKDCLPDSHKVVLAKDYDGELHHDFKISKDYWIMPRDEAMAEAFKKHGVAVNGTDIYRADIKGTHFDLDYDRIAFPDGRQMIYYFKTNWKAGRKLPEIEITHLLPKKDVNEASLKNANQRMGRLNEKVFDLGKKKLELEANLKEIQGYLKIENDKANKFKAHTTEARSLLDKGLTQINNEIPKLIKNAKDTIEDAVERIKRAEGEITKRKKALKEFVDKVMELEKTKIHLAVIIQKKRSTVEALETLCDLIITAEAQPDKAYSAGKDSDLLIACRTFKEIFTKNKKTLFENSEKNLEAFKTSLIE